MQENNKYEIKKLDWDTNFFGINSAKVILKEEISICDIEDIIEELKRKNYKFITIQNVDNNDNNNIILKEINGIFLADVNVQFKKMIKEDEKKSEFDKNIVIQKNMLYDEEILNISNTAFIYSRFINDKNLKNGDKVYYEWTKNSFNKSNKLFCVYKINNKSVGYLLFSIENKELIIELIAVNKEYKGKGIGHKLISSVVQFAIRNEIECINVGTQLNNIYAQNFYINCGFKHITNHSIYHLWY